MGICQWRSEGGKVNRAATIAVGAIPLLWLVACSKDPSQASIAVAAGGSSSAVAQAAPASAMQVSAVQNLERFRGKPPGDLLTDESIGKVIRALVPQSQFKCLDDLLNYMPDLEALADGAVVSKLSGSHADRFMEGYVSAAPNGTVVVVLQCDPQAAPKAKYQYFTNAGLGSPPPKAVLDWMYVVGSDGDVISKSDGKERVEVAFSAFVESLRVGAASAATVSSSGQLASSGAPLPTRTAVAAGQPNVNGVTVSAADLAGSWTCQTTGSNGGMVEEAYDFQPQGSFSSADQRTRLTGSYEVSGSTVSLRVLGATQGGTTVASDAIVDLRVDALTNEELRFQSVVRRSGTARRSACMKTKPPVQAQATRRSTGNGQQVRYLPAGSVICLSVRSFYKVNAIERTGNQLASLPDDCDHIGTDSRVNVLKTTSDPVVGMLHLVGNAGGTVYVRMSDLR